MSLTEFVSRPFPVLAKLAFVLRNIPAVQFVFAKCAALLGAGNAISEPLARKLPEAADVAADMIEQPVVALQMPGDIVVAEPEPEPEAEAEPEPDEKCAALLGTDQTVREPLVRTLPEAAPGIAAEMVEQPVVALQMAGEIVVAEPEPDGKCAALLRADQAMCEPLTRKSLEAAPGIAPETVELPVVALQWPGDIVVTEPELEPEPDQFSAREQLIRRRWAETGIKMWNPDFHGAGRAALNIQGRVELLPAKPGENLPRYDKLEFRQIGERIVCEGVVVDPPKRRK